MAMKVPMSFEGYVEAEHGGWDAAGRCDGCLREADRLTGEGFCPTCTRELHGFARVEFGITEAQRLQLRRIEAKLDEVLSRLDGNGRLR